jgi:hypothetical protein
MISFALVKDDSSQDRKNKVEGRGKKIDSWFLK